MTNLFKDIDDQLSDMGWRPYYDNPRGFRFVKKLNSEIFHFADFDGDRIVFYDHMLIGVGGDAISIDENELNLFAMKIKKWRKKYGRNTENRHDAG